jgi:hypothetical protein
VSSAGQKLVAGRVPGERIATDIDTADSGTFTTTETVVSSVVAALVSGRTYRVRWVGGCVTTVANDVYLCRLREDSLVGTALMERNRVIGTTSASGEALECEVEYTAVATGNKTFVSTGVRNGGTGTLHADATASRPRYLYVDYIRG